MINLVWFKSLYCNCVNEIISLFCSFIADCVNVLRLQLMEEMDFTLVPEEAWNSLVQWYSLASGQVRNFILQFNYK